MTDLREYISEIQDAGEVLNVKSRASPVFEIAGITAKADGSHALMFDDVEGSNFRLVANLVGTRKRFAAAVGAPEGGIHGKIIAAIGNARPPETVSSGKFMENKTRNASCLPVVTHFEKEPGPFITSSMVYVRNPDTGMQNSSFHRMMPIGDAHFSIRMVEERHLHRCFLDAVEHGEDLKAAVTVGVHPAISIAGAYQDEWGSDEINVANSLLDGKLTLTRLPITGLVVPSEAEIVMEGRILSDRTHEEWMVEMLQTYDHKRHQPVFEVDCLYYRNNPIFHDILSGYSEHRLLMGMPIESKLNREVKEAFPQTHRVSLTTGGCNWMHAVVQIEKTHESDPRRVIEKTFASHRSLKQVVVVDPDIDPDNADSVEYAMATRFQADRDIVILKNVRGSSLDPSSDQTNLKTAKMGIDATRSLEKRPEGFEIAQIPGIDGIDLARYAKTDRTA